jgi:hypothetical protein
MPVLLLINILVGPATIWVLIDLGTEDNFLNASWAKKYLLTASMRLSQAEAIDGQTIQSYGQQNLLLTLSDNSGVERTSM